MTRLFRYALLAAVFAMAPCCAAAAGAGDPRAVAASVEHDLRVQDQLPSDHGRMLIVDGAGSAGSAGSGTAVTTPAMGSLFTTFAWVALAAAVVFIVVSLGAALLDRRAIPVRALRTAAAADDEAVAASRRVLISADELAAAGRYTEAIHQLLADALTTLRRRIDGDLSDALTSREILRAVALAPLQRGALHDMIARVEETWFAQRTAALDDYAAVRRSFETFTAGSPAAA